eukprot:TRINITY_DN74154_c0_g1_i1.p1 TRINITY_DN74154_c0_g1~~TRINITY_DN74154_c0_g1_i1.p1  ORF type:complete len:900 (+),score=135.61 TRINITY_DN74154_c0_g1_i1:83-2782(+)
MAGCFGWLALALPILTMAVIPFNRPFQIVRPTANHSSMLAVLEGLGQLAQHEGPIALISVVGPYHSGKSFLLNALLQDTQAFSVGKKTSPETMGVWLCRTNLTAADGSEVWLMDSEGFFGPGIDEGYDAKVFTVATLVGAHVVYNTVKNIDQQALGLLEMLVQRAQLFRTRNAATSLSTQEPDFLRTDGFPPLTWVVEDFVQELPDRFRQEGTTGWLRTYLEGSGLDDDSTGGKHRQHKSDFLNKVFHDVRVHTLFLPATGRDQLQDLSRLGWHDLTQEFRSEVGDLRRHLLTGLHARQASGKATNGPALARSLQFIVRGLQQGMFSELPSLWDAWTSQVAAVSLTDAEAWFAGLSEKLDSGDEPVPIATFNNRLDESRETTTKFYRALLRDFNARPDTAELRRRLDVHLTERLLPAYYERVHLWIAQKSAGAKDKLRTVLEAQVLPMDPSKLDRVSSETAGAAKQTFASIVANFSYIGAGRTLSSVSGLSGLVVHMPSFSLDPGMQLATDLQTMHGARMLQNEQAVQHLFKQALRAADEAVSRELRAISGGVAFHASSNAVIPNVASPNDVTASPNTVVPLLSRGRVKALRALAEQRCWRAFDDHLAPHPWAKSVPQYMTNRALVQSEFLEARLAAFSAANEQRLRNHFSGALDRALSAYRANRSLIHMPAPEGNVQADHAQQAAWAQEVLIGSVKDLMDTDAFGEVRKRFDASMREGLVEVLEKNIEVWKAYSDEATRCAVAANRALGQQCSIFCFFRNVPWSHKSTSRRHLSECLGKSAMGSRMSAPLRAQVFDAWYKKDMSYEVQQVSNRFWAWLFTILALSVVAWWRCSRTAQISWQQQQGYYYSQQPMQQQQFYSPVQTGYNPDFSGIQSRAAAACGSFSTAPQRRFSWRGGA